MNRSTINPPPNSQKPRVEQSSPLATQPLGSRASLPAFPAKHHEQTGYHEQAQSAHASIPPASYTPLDEFLPFLLTTYQTQLTRLVTHLNQSEDPNDPKTQSDLRLLNTTTRTYLAAENFKLKVTSDNENNNQDSPKQNTKHQGQSLGARASLPAFSTGHHEQTGYHGQAKPPHTSPPSASSLQPSTSPTNPVTFAKEALNLNLFPHQEKLCLSKQRITMLIAGRGAGKSLAARVVALFHAYSRPHHTVLVVSSGQRMSSDFGSRLLDLLRNSDLRDLTTKISNEQVRFKNGSEIKLLPANPDTIRGYHPKTGAAKSGMTIILDEACFMENGDEIRKAVEYALITTPTKLGQLFIVTSPSSIHSWVHAYALRAEDKTADTAVIQCASDANPLITKEELNRLHASKNEHEYRAEVLGQWVENAYGLFTGHIDKNIIPTGELEPLTRRAVYGLGADLALSFSQNHDRNALAVAARWKPDPKNHPDDFRYRLLEMEVLDHASDHELKSVVNRLREKYKIGHAVIEQYQGKALAEHCQNKKIETELLAPTAGNQQTVFHEMHRLLRQNILELPADLCQTFFDELRAFEYRREPNGHTSFGHPTSGKFHDDTVYAAAWAIHAANQIDYKPPPYSGPPLIKFAPKH